MKRNKIFNSDKTIAKRVSYRNRQILYKDFRYALNLNSEQHYLGLFRHKQSKKAGDISPSNFDISVNTIQYIKDKFPDVKLILTLREPVERLWSHVKMNIVNNHINISAENIENAFHRVLENSKDYPLPGFQSWQEIFDDDKIFVGFFDELIESPIDYLKKICQFLEISDDLENCMQLRQGQSLQELFHNPNKTKLDLEMPAKLRKISHEFFIPKVEDLHNTIKRPYTELWLHTYSQYLHSVKNAS